VFLLGLVSCGEDKKSFFESSNDVNKEKLEALKPKLSKAKDDIKQVYLRRLDLFISTSALLDYCLEKEDATNIPRIVLNAKDRTSVFRDADLLRRDIKEAKNDRQLGNCEVLLRRYKEIFYNYYMVAKENIPAIKNSSKFSRAEAQLEGTENRINKAKADYNKIAKQYNKIAVESKSTVIEVYPEPEQSTVNIDL